MYRKRRIQPSPNKNLAKVRRAENQRNRQQLSDVYPNVERLSVNLRFVSPQGHILADTRRQFGPSDVLDLEAPCPGRCGDGRMDLDGKIDSAIQQHATSSEGRGRCNRPVYMGSASEECGTELQCRIEVSYRS